MKYDYITWKPRIECLCPSTIGLIVAPWKFAALKKMTKGQKKKERKKENDQRQKMIKGQYSPVWLEQATLISSLLYGNLAMLVLNLLAFKNKTYTAHDHFHDNSLYGKIPTKKEPIRSRLDFPQDYMTTLRYKNSHYFWTACRRNLVVNNKHNRSVSRNYQSDSCPWKISCTEN